MFKSTMIAGAGGFLGTCLRFLSEKLGAAICYLSFPLGTFMANMVGCIIIGMLYGYLNKTGRLSKTANLLWITGFCGGLTTFSSFSDERWRLRHVCVLHGDNPRVWYRNGCPRCRLHPQTRC